jgi:hypothetical protein
MKRFLRSATLFSLIVLLMSFLLDGGWYKGGTKSAAYEMDYVQGGGQDGKDAFTIRSIETKIDGFGMLVHDNTPGFFLGKRVRMKAWMKTSNVKGWAGIYLRVDKSGMGLPVVTDNMHDRPVKGTTGWKKYEAVVDVPANGSKIIYGAMLSGTGQIWFENPVLEEVALTVPVTAHPAK